MLKPAPLIMFLNDLKDPRKRINGCEHKFIDILMKRKRKRAGWNNDYLTGLLKTFMFSPNLYSNENDYPRA